MINTAESPTRTGRPKSDSKRQAIMGAATVNFLTEGYERTSMDAIANAASVSKQTVYSHFANKDELFRECILCKTRMYGLDMQGFTPDMPIRDVLTATGHRFLELLSDDDVISMYRLLIAETTAFPKLAASFWETGPEATIDAIARFIQSSVEHGNCQISETRQAASDFLLLVEGHFLKRRLMRHADQLSQQEKDQQVSRCVKQILRLYDQPTPA